LLTSGLTRTSQPMVMTNFEVGDMLDMNTLDTVIPSRQFLTELVERLDTLTRFCEVQGETAGFREEACKIAGAMKQRAAQLAQSLALSRRKADSLADVRTVLLGLGQLAVLNEYDRSLSEFQNEVGDEVNQHEAAMEAADVPGRDVLDKLEAEHFQLHRIMREVVAL
jgi:hypothetical protein